jgi:glycosyltransferase involved in cell wall biosynthesis
MSSGTPSVSVVMPVHDAAAFVAEAIESLLVQSFRDFELIAVDDGSSDRSYEILEGYAKRDPRVVVRRIPHTGVIAARNAGLSLCRASLVACMDADDVCLPDRLALQVASLSARPEVVCIGGGFEVIDAKGRLLDRVIPPDEHEALEAMALRGRSPICGSNAMFRHREAEAIGGYDATAALAEDLDLWLRFAETAKLANLRQVISRVRFHDASQSAREQAAQLEAVRDVTNRARRRRGIEGAIATPQPWRPLATRRSRQDFAVGWARSAWRLGERRTAFAYAVKALCIDPLGAPLWKSAVRGVSRIVWGASCPK